MTIRPEDMSGLSRLVRTFPVEEVEARAAPRHRGRLCSKRGRHRHQRSYRCVVYGRLPTVGYLTLALPACAAVTLYNFGHYPRSQPHVFRQELLLANDGRAELALDVPHRASACGHVTYRVLTSLEGCRTRPYVLSIVLVGV